MSDDLSAIVSRIRKLLALARDGRGNENEAAIAAEKAQQLMQDYNIELASIEAAAGDKWAGGKREKTLHSRPAMYKWQRNLMGCLADTHFCLHFIEEVNIPHESRPGEFRRAKRHFLLGRPVNVQLVGMTYDYLVEAMDRLLPYSGTGSMGRGGAEALAWKDGCSDRLIYRLRDRFEQAKRQAEADKREQEARSRHPGAAAHNALVLVDVIISEADLNNDALRGYEPGTTARRRAESEAASMSWRAEHQRKQQEFMAAGHSQEDAWYLAHGLSVPSKAVDRPMTDAQRRRKEKSDQTWERRYESRRNREYNHYARPGYTAGSRAGDEIGLDRQVNHSSTKGIK